jgi:hypothetical protein
MSKMGNPLYKTKVTLKGLIVDLVNNLTMKSTKSKDEWLDEALTKVDEIFDSIPIKGRKGPKHHSYLTLVNEERILDQFAADHNLRWKLWRFDENGNKGGKITVAYIFNESKTIQTLGKASKNVNETMPKILGRVVAKARAVKDLGYKRIGGKWKLKGSG